MKGVKPAKSHCMRDSALDKLSNLPSHLLDQILSGLPFMEAVRTSVLSSKWRFKWTTMPNLVFDKDCFSFTPHDQRFSFTLHGLIMMNNKIVNVIDRALLRHTGLISKFKLYQIYPISTTDLDQWILYLSRCFVQELILEIRDGQCYMLHSCLFSFQNLVHLELVRCHLKLPSTFGGFKKLKRLILKSLILKSLTMAQDVFETLISSCPTLESLTLVKVDGFTHLNIDAPNLLNFFFKGYFDDINFVNTSNLASVTIELVIGRAATERTKPRVSSNLLKFLSSLPRIRRLVIECDFLEYLATGGMQGQLSNPCPDLDYLYLDLYIDDYAVSSAALCLLRSCPNIQELEIRVYLLKEECTFWESVDNNLCFNKLRTVNIYGISGNRHELEFIRLMLGASPVLQKMTIEPYSGREAPRLLRELQLRSHPASAKAEVVIGKHRLKAQLGLTLISYQDL